MNATIEKCLQLESGSKQSHVFVPRFVLDRMEIPRNNEDYRTLEYWDKRYEEEESYEWFMGYGAFRHLMNRDIKTSDTILTLGRVQYYNSAAIHLLYYNPFLSLIRPF